MNQPLLAPDVPIDLSNCDLEPIHIPSSIQPHGMLLAARSSDLRIAYVSENTESFLGVTPSYVLERTLHEILGSDAVDSIENALGQDFYVPKDIHTYKFPLCGEKRFDVTAHRTQGLLCLELEHAEENRRWDLLSSRLEGAMRTLGLAKSLPDLCAATAPVLRNLTGYDRVMVYKFDADGHGEVVAEDKAPEMEPFLGLHYPATDIPAQARRLFLQQRFRTIIDVNYVPVPLLGNRLLIDSAPLDMTYCGLRSVSPIHIEYLRNMGVGASLSISLIVGGELWGMILCHHRRPRHLDPESRALCDLLGQLVSLFLGVTQQSDEAAQERQKRALLEVLATSIETGLPIDQSLVNSRDTLLALAGADGAILRIGGRLSLIGTTPGPDEASSLLTAFEARIRGGTASSDEIGSIMPAFSHLAASASGGLMVALGGGGNGVLWLRSQMAETVRWAGKPDASKHLFEGSFRLSPRKSFAAWEQIQHGRSIPWRAVEIEAALSLERITARALLVQLTLDLAESHKRARERLQVINQELEEFAYVASHDLKAPLRVIDNASKWLEKDLAEHLTEKTRKTMKLLRGRVQRMERLLDDLLEYARIGRTPEGPPGEALAGDILIKNVLTLLPTSNFKIAVSPAFSGIQLIRMPLQQILGNLIDNAIKHHDKPQGCIELTVKAGDEFYEFAVRDDGPGIPVQFHDRIFKMFQTLRPRDQVEGSGMGLALARKTVELFGGVLSVESTAGEGSTFRFTWPKDQRTRGQELVQ